MAANSRFIGENQEIRRVTEHKLNLFEMLNALDNNDGDWLSRQSTEDAKEFVPLVVMRWLSALQQDCPQSAYMLLAVNDRVNTGLFSLSQHPELIFRLMASCGLGADRARDANRRPVRHQYIKSMTPKYRSKAISAVLLEQFPGANDLELDILLQQLDRPGFAQFLDACGIQPQDAKGLMEAYDKRNPNTTPSKTKKTQAKT